MFCLFAIIFLYKNISFASSYTLCKGADFNRRIKLLLSGENYNDEDNKITSFRRGTNPPYDKNKYVDVSEDMDETIIVYRENNVLYYYTNNAVFMNEDSSHMFEKFRKIRTIDISEWIYNYVRDTRYMFASCHMLTTIKFKKISTEKNVVPPVFNLVEMQGMYYDCQSLVDIHMELMDTSRVENMTEVFAKCHNVKNIYVDKDKWNISNCRFFTKMFENCYLLKTNKGRKIVDVNEESYETYAIPGTDYVEGALKDINTKYLDYGEHDGKAPVDDKGSALQIQETTVNYLEEPEEDGNGNYGSGIGNGIGTSNGKPYVGDKSTGYNDEKETGLVSNVIVPTNPPIETTIEETYIVQTYEESSLQTRTYLQEENIQTISPYEESSLQVEIQEKESTKIIQTEEESQMIESSVHITQPFENQLQEEKVEEIETGKQQKVMELDEYLRERAGGGDGLEEGNDQNMQEEKIMKFYLFALMISVLAILLLVGVVIFLAKDNSENNKNNIKNNKNE